MKKILLFIIVSLLSLPIIAQDTPLVTFGMTRPTDTVRTCNGLFYDSGMGSAYERGEYKVLTLFSTTVSPIVTLTVTFDSLFDVYIKDTLFIYDGPSTASPLLRVGPLNATYANNINPLAGAVIRPSCNNTTNSLTFVFKSSNDVLATPAQGWKARVKCENVCDNFTVNLDTTFYKIINGQRVPGTISFNNVEYRYKIAPTGRPWDTIDTLYYNTIDLCHNNGDSIELIANAGYSYIPCLTTGPITYKWEFGNGDIDSISGNTAQSYYKRVTGYDLLLSAKDNYCLQKTTARIRIAKDPILSVKALPDLCTDDRYTLKIGYTAGSSVILDTIAQTTITKKTFTDTVFIPDGQCPDENGVLTYCYRTKVTFEEYPGQYIRSGADICAVCLNIEHSFVGDLAMYLVCPNGQKSTLMTYNGGNTPPAGVPYGSPPRNGGAYFGIMYEPDGSARCDASVQIKGTPWQYCWSEKYLANSLGTMGPHTRSSSGRPMDSTHYTAKEKFYLPDSTFDNLIGCPINGNWFIEVCDYWPSDNGWTFGWSMEFCDDLASGGWNYQVPIDTTIWTGPFLQNYAATSVDIVPTEGGYFKYDMKLIDVFGCEWDTNTHLTTLQRPIIKLPADTTICSGVTSVVLDSGVPDTNAFPNTYIWEPTGETTKSITVPKTLQSTTQYKVEVTSMNKNKSCASKASTTINVVPSPTPSFLPSIFPTEGCEPLTVTFNNMSDFSDVYEWNLGDGTKSKDVDVTHTYNKGTYSVLLRARNEYGCRDSVYYENLIKVFSVPKAEFSWSPQLPSLLDPTIRFINMTEPQSNENHYTWQVQSDLKDPLSYNYIFDSINPYYTFATDKGAEVAGVYTASLFSSTINTPPSGHVYECIDTATHTITLLNDFLQFPNVVTANNDGINDVFKITNLVKGTAFPLNELTIFDRWGRTVYHKKNMTENDAWDPKADKVAAGTYFYKFVVKGIHKDNEFKGIIEVLNN